MESQTPITRLPILALRPFVAIVWAGGNVASEGWTRPLREHLLPTGMMHLVFRLNEDPLRIFDVQDDPVGQRIGGAIVGGARSRFYIRELSAPSSSVGAVLRPGAAERLLGTTADALAETHTSLDDLWGRSARSVRERLVETKSNADRLALLESALLARLPHVRSLHPAIASLLNEGHPIQSVDAWVRQGGISHRHFIAHFRRAVGLSPKTYLRVLRFQRALHALRQGKSFSLVALAADAGYSDQAHFNRDFLAFTGVTPTTYQRRSPTESNHLPFTAPGSQT